MSAKSNRLTNLKIMTMSTGQRERKKREAKNNEIETRERVQFVQRNVPEKEAGLRKIGLKLLALPAAAIIE